MYLSVALEQTWDLFLHNSLPYPPLSLQSKSELLLVSDVFHLLEEREENNKEK